jgi:hypothetical protein
MRYFVILADGRRFGPADVTTLTAWANEGRISPDTEVENEENGVKGLAREIPGLKFKTAEDLLIRQPEPKPTESVQGTYQYGNPAATGAYQQPPGPASAAYNRHADDGSSKLITNAWIMVALGFFFWCAVLTPFGIYSANRALRMGNQNAKPALTVAWVVLAIQVLSYLVFMIPFALAFAATGSQGPN